MYYTDDPVRDAERYQRELRPLELVYPECEYCKEPIKDEELIDNDGELVHIECFLSACKCKTNLYMRRR